MIYDGAGFHLKAAVHELLPRVDVVTLPPYSPELNRVEGLWDGVRNGLCNWVFESLGQREEELTPVLQSYWENAHQVLRGVHGWIRRIATALLLNIIPVFKLK